MLLLAACGDDLRGPAPIDIDPRNPTTTTESPAARRWVPELCDLQTWPEMASKDMAMSVITTSNGQSIFGVDRVSGALVGYAIDKQGKMTSSGMKVASGGFTALAATEVAGHAVVATVTGGATLLSLVSDDFTRVDQVAKLDGSLVAPIADANGLHLALTAGPSGVNVAGFDASWHLKGVATLAPDAIGLAVTSTGADALVAWSTNTGCVVEELGFVRTATGLSACRSPRLAAGIGDRAELAYEGPGGVWVGDLYMSGNNAIASTRKVGVGSSPRIVFDGERYWMAYLNARGNVNVGFLSPDFNTLVSFALDDVSPATDAFDLKMVDGRPVVFSASATGYAAHGLCVAIQ